MDAAIGDELLEGEASDLTPNGIEAGDDDRVRRVVDDHVDAGSQLERANVAALAADEASLLLVVLQRHRGHSDLGRVLGGYPLNRQGYDLLRYALSVLRRLHALLHVTIISVRL